MRRIALGLALSSVLVSQSHAVGLGEIRTNSSLNQPLSANIELVETSPSDIDDIQVTLAPNEVFEQVGIARSSVLDQLEFVPTFENGVPTIKVVSLQPIQEPFLNFVLEVTWANGKLLREYTVLLDPPVFSDTQIAAAPPATLPVEAPSFVEVPEVPVAVAETLPAAEMPVAGIEDLRSGSDVGLDPFVTVPSAPIDTIADADASMYDGLQTFPVDGAIETPRSVDSGLSAGEEVSALNQPTFQPAPAGSPRYDDYPIEQTFSLDDQSIALADNLAGGTDQIFVDAPVPASSIAQTEMERLFDDRPARNATRPAPRPVAKASQGYLGGNYRVRRGDTLSKIAQRVNGSRKQNQTMVALLRSNPEAFINGNMNLVRSGYVLRVPTAGDINQISSTEALAEVNGQLSAWREYRGTIAGVAAPQMDSSRFAGIADLEGRIGGALAVPTETASVADSGVQSEPGNALPVNNDLAGVDDLAAPPKADLEILVPEGRGDSVEGGIAQGTGSIGNIERELSLAKEKLESQTQQNTELRSRVAELESLLESKNRLIELKNEQLSELQDQVGVSGEETAKADSALEEKAAAAAAAAKESVMSAADEAKGMLPKSDIEAPSVVASDETATESGAETKLNESPAVKEEVKEKPAEASLVSELKNNPNLLMGVGFGGLLLGALGFLLLRRGNKEQPVEEYDDLPEPGEPVIGSSLAARNEEPVFGNSVAQVVEESDVAVSNLVSVPAVEDNLVGGGELSAASGLSDDDEMLSEANVYLAYGLPDQAIDLLKPVVDANPGRVDYAAKLAEAYHATGRKDEFMSLSSKVKGHVDSGSAADWSKIAVMGKDLVPGDDLFVNEETGDLSMTQIRTRPPELASVGESDSTLSGDDSLMLGDLNADSDGSGHDFTLDDQAVLNDIANEQRDETLSNLRSASLEINSDLDKDLHDFDDLDVDNLGLSLDDDLVERSEVMDTDLSSVRNDLEDELSLDTLVGDDDSNGLFSTGEDEVSTKLDLAKAYLDMGDDEGAREALEEVLTLGNSEQRAEAARLKAQLD